VPISRASPPTFEEDISRHQPLQRARVSAGCREHTGITATTHIPLIRETGSRWAAGATMAHPMGDLMAGAVHTTPPIVLTATVAGTDMSGGATRLALEITGRTRDGLRGRHLMAAATAMTREATATAQRTGVTWEAAVIGEVMGTSIRKTMAGLRGSNIAAAGRCMIKHGMPVRPEIQLRGEVRCTAAGCRGVAGDTGAGVAMWVGRAAEVVVVRGWAPMTAYIPEIALAARLVAVGRRATEEGRGGRRENGGGVTATRRAGIGSILTSVKGAQGPKVMFVGMAEVAGVAGVGGAGTVGSIGMAVVTGVQGAGVCGVGAGEMGAAVGDPTGAATTSMCLCSKTRILLRGAKGQV